MRDSAPFYISDGMTRYYDMDANLEDRARLAERFYGVTHTVLARA